MKAKELAKKLMENPEVDVMIADSSGKDFNVVEAAIVSQGLYQIENKFSGGISKVWADMWENDEPVYATRVIWRIQAG